MPLPILPTLRGSMCQLPKPQHNTKDHPGRIHLRRPRSTPGFNTRLCGLQWATRLRRFRVWKWPLPQELTPSLSVKGLVFGDGLLFMALAGVGKVRYGGVGALPLFIQTEVIVVQHLPTIPAFLSVRGPRPSDVNLCAAGPSVTHPSKRGSDLAMARVPSWYYSAQHACCRRRGDNDISFRSARIPNGLATHRSRIKSGYFDDINDTIFTKHPFFIDIRLIFQHGAGSYLVILDSLGIIRLGPPGLLRRREKCSSLHSLFSRLVLLLFMHRLSGHSVCWGDSSHGRLHARRLVFVSVFPSSFVLPRGGLLASCCAFASLRWQLILVEPLACIPYYFFLLPFLRGVLCRSGLLVSDFFTRNLHLGGWKISGVFGVDIRAQDATAAGDRLTSAMVWFRFLRLRRFLSSFLFWSFRSSQFQGRAWSFSSIPSIQAGCMFLILPFVCVDTVKWFV